MGDEFKEFENSAPTLSFDAPVAEAEAPAAAAAQAPTPEWGLMLSTGRDNMLNAMHLTLFPGLAIFITVLSFNLLGDGLRDALDPRLKD